MIIKLKNFRCYRNRTFDLGNNGLTLISGKSGIGKSNLILAIYFALYGKGTKVQTFGKNSCTVELEFDGMKIVRNKRPNRLIVNDIYKDDTAQKIIDKKFGNMFDVTGYISQDATNTFIKMTPVDKLAFLERFSFENIDLSTIKERCKSLIKQRKDIHSQILGKLEATTNMLQSLEIPTKIPFPIPSSLKNRNKVIDREKIRYKNCGILIRKQRQTIKNLTYEHSALISYQTTINTRIEYMTRLSKEIERLEKENSDLIFPGNDNLLSLQQNLEILISRRRLIDFEKTYNQRLNQYQKIENESKERLKEIEERLWNEHSKDEVETMIEDNKTCFKAMQRLEELTKRLEEYRVDDTVVKKSVETLSQLQENEKMLSERLQKLKIESKILFCPSCQSKLCLHKDSLILLSTKSQNEDIGTVKKSIIDVREKIKTTNEELANLRSSRNEQKKCEKSIRKINEQYEIIPSIEVEEELSSLQSYYREQLLLSKEKERNNYSSILNELEIQLQKDETELEKLRQGKDQTILSTEDELREKISKTIKTRDRKEELEQRIDSLNKDLEKYRNMNEKDREEYLKKYSLRKESEVKGDIEECEEVIKDLENKEKKHSENLEQIQLYIEYKKTYNNYKDWEKKVASLQTEEKEIRKKVTASETLRIKILEAESIAIHNVIESINTHAQVYLDLFFPDNPITVCLEPFKETKKSKKPQINLTIDYKGMDCDLTMLSGGELSRVVLAFTLALGEIFNTPLLMLDESTSSLDQDLTTTVINGIRDNFKGKLVLIIAHQVVQGTYDRVLRLN